MKSKSAQKQQGLSLVEMMVALAIGMVVISGALYLSTTAMAVSRDNIRMSFLNQELSNAMNLITKDLRRASYWGGAIDATRVSTVSAVTFSAVTGSGVTLTLTYDATDVSDGVVDSLGAQAKNANAQLVYLEKDTASPYAVMKYTATITNYDPDTNAFTADLTETFPATVLASGGAVKGSWGIVAPVMTATLAGNCVTFSYDVDGDGQINTGTDTDERFGFRYDSTEKAVESRTNGAGCAATGWENVTDENRVEITIFTITDELPTSIPVGNFTVGIREYTIKMKGHLKSDTGIERELRETIRVRNDKVT